MDVPVNFHSQYREHILSLSSPRDCTVKNNTLIYDMERVVPNIKLGIEEKKETNNAKNKYKKARLFCFKGRVHCVIWCLWDALPHLGKIILLGHNKVQVRARPQETQFLR